MTYLKLLTALFSLLLISNCSSYDVEKIFESYLWDKRVVLVFSPSFDDEQTKEQARLFKNAKQGFKERDVVFWQIINLTQVAINGEAKPHLATPPFYEYFEVPKDTFTLVVLGKDGEIKLNQHMAVTTSALFELIDAMPMRKKELEEQLSVKE